MKSEGNIDLTGCQIKNVRMDNVASLPTVGATDRGRFVLDSTSPKWWDGTKWNFFYNDEIYPWNTAFVDTAFTMNTDNKYDSIVNAYNAGFRSIVVYDDGSRILPSYMADTSIFCIGFNTLLVNGGNFIRCNIYGKNSFIGSNNTSTSVPYRTSDNLLTLADCNIDVKKIYDINVDVTGETGTLIKSDFFTRNKISIANDNGTTNKSIVIDVDSWVNNELVVGPYGSCQLSINKLFGNSISSVDYSRITNLGSLNIVKMNKPRYDLPTSISPYARGLCSEFITSNGRLSISNCNIKFSFTNNSVARYFITNSGNTYISNCNIYIDNSITGTLINNLGVLALGSVLSNKSTSGVTPVTGSVYVSNNQFN